MPKRQRRSRGNSELYDELHISPPKRKYDVENAVGGAGAKSADLPKDEEKEITRMSPKTILFFQDTINYKFEDGTKLNETLTSLKSGEVTVDSIPKITVIPAKEQEKYFTHDNRRLCVFQKYKDYLGEKLLIPVIIGKSEDLGRKRPTAERRSHEKSVKIMIEDFKGSRKDGKLLETWACPKNKRLSRYCKSSKKKFHKQRSKSALKQTSNQTFKQCRKKIN